MELLNYFKSVVFDNYANFKGRARRKEFISFIAVYYGINLILLFLSQQVGVLSFVLSLLGLALLVPSIAVMVRRIHDIGKSGWWALLMLVPVINLAFFIYILVKDGESTPNKYGFSPK